MVAIYAGFVAAGIAFVAWPNNSSILTGLTSWRAYFLLSLPMLADIFSQTLGLRDSNWRWRSSTGFLFGLATTWYFYSRFKRIADYLRKQSGEEKVKESNKMGTPGLITIEELKPVVND